MQWWWQLQSILPFWFDIIHQIWVNDEMSVAMNQVIWNMFDEMSNAVVTLRNYASVFLIHLFCLPGSVNVCFGWLLFSDHFLALSLSSKTTVFIVIFLSFPKSLVWCWLPSLHVCHLLQVSSWPAWQRAACAPSTQCVCSTWLSADITCSHKPEAWLSSCQWYWKFASC